MRPGRPGGLQPAKPAAVTRVPALAALWQQLQGSWRVQVRLDHHLQGAGNTVSHPFLSLPVPGAISHPPHVHKGTVTSLDQGGGK